MYTCPHLNGSVCDLCYALQRIDMGRLMSEEESGRLSRGIVIDGPITGTPIGVPREPPLATAAEVASLRADIASLKAMVETLKARIAELEQRS